MITGYTRPLYLLPFDHRASYISGLFGWKEPLNVEQMVTVAHNKQVIYAGFQQAIADQVPKDRVGILVACERRRGKRHPQEVPMKCEECQQELWKAGDIVPAGVYARV